MSHKTALVTMLCILLLGYGLVQALSPLGRRAATERACGVRPAGGHSPAFPAGLGPLLACCFIILVMLLAGCLGSLRAGTLVLYLLSALCGGLVLYNGVRKGFKTLLPYWGSAGVLAFGAACVVIYLVYRRWPPMYCQWDEFSHWGMFYKLSWETDKLHIFSSIVPASRAYPQAASAFHAFTALLLPAFSEASTHFSLAILYAACGASVFCRLDSRHKALTALSVCALPFFFCVFTHINPYITVYNDTLMGAFFGAALVVAVAFPKGGWGGAAALALTLAALVQVKESGVLFGAMALAVWVLFTLLRPTAGGFWASVRRNLGGDFWLRALVTGGAMLASLLGWKLALRLALGSARSPYTRLALGKFFGCVRAALTGADPYAGEVLQSMAQTLAGQRLLPLPYCSAWVCLGLLTLASVVVAVVCVKKRRAWHLAATLLAMPLFFGLYLAALYYSYLCAMSTREALGAASLMRYVSTFFAGWLMLLLALMLLYAPLLMNKRLAGILCGSVLFLLVYFDLYLVVKQNVLYTGCFPDTIAPQRHYAGQLSPHLAPGDKIWVLFSDATSLDDLADAHIYQYLLLPADADWRLGYAQFIPDHLPNWTTGMVLDRQVVRADIAAAGVDYVLLLSPHGGVDGAFEAEFGPLFADGLSRIRQTGAPVLYQVNASETGPPLVPVVETVAPEPAAPKPA